MNGPFIKNENTTTMHFQSLCLSLSYKPTLVYNGHIPKMSSTFFKFFQKKAFIGYSDTPWTNIVKIFKIMIIRLFPYSWRGRHQEIPEDIHRYLMTFCCLFLFLSCKEQIANLFAGVIFFVLPFLHWCDSYTIYYTSI